MEPITVIVSLGVIWILGSLLGGTKKAGASEAPAPSAPPGATPEVVKAIQARESKLPSDMPSPIPGVSDAAWAKYVGMWKQADAAAVTTDGRRGVFLIGLPTLVDQGYMKRIGKGTGKLYHAEWKAPYSQVIFAKNLKLQYDILAEQARRHYKSIMAQYAKDIGSPIDVNGKSVTFSLAGAMAIARQAALGGLAKWIEDPATRMGNTTDIFTKFNGIF